MANDDPYRAFNFTIEINGLEVGGFSECTGLASETEVIEYRNGNDVRSKPRKLPGLHRCPNIVLRRGITANRELWGWRKSVLDGQPDRRDGRITLRNAAHEDVQRWLFRAGWPVRYEGPRLDANASAVAIETLEIAHEGLELDDS